MFCPKCGRADQTPETYCRQCGTFLPDLTKPKKKKHTAEEHVKVNTVLSAMTIVAAFTLAILLYVFVAFRPDTHPLIYVTAGFLLAIGGWQIQTLWRIRLLKRQLPQLRPSDPRADEDQLSPPASGRELTPADFESNVPASVVERTTTLLEKERRR